MGDGKTQGSRAMDQLGTKLATGVGGVYDSGYKVYGKDLNAGLGSQTRSALTDLWTGANRNTEGLKAANKFNTGMISGTGLTGGQTASMGGLKQLGDEYSVLATKAGQPNYAQGVYTDISKKLANPSWAEGAFKDFAGTARAPSLTEKTMMDVARGKQIGEKNPYLMKLLDRSAADTSADMAAGFGAAGRFGSSNHAGALADSVSQTRAQALYDDYEKSLARQRQALGDIEGMRQQGNTNYLNALGASDAARRGNLSDRMSALGQSETIRRNSLLDQAGMLDREAGVQRDLFGMGQQGTANRFAASDRASGLYDSLLDPARTRLGVGQTLDANSQAELLAQNDLFRRKSDGDYSNLARILGLFTGMNGMPGTQKETPWWQTLASTGIGLGSVFL